MKTTDKNPASSPLSKKRFFTFGTLGIMGASVLIHFCLLLLVGGAVIIQGVIPKSVFESALPVESVTEETVQPSEEKTEDLPESLPDPATQEQPPVPVPDFNSVPEVIPADANVSTQVISMSNPSTSKVNFVISNGSDSNGTDTGKNGAPRIMNSLFGNKGETQNGLIGYLYDLKQDSKQKDTNMAVSKDDGMFSAQNGEYRKVLVDFLSNWNPKVLEKYYKSPAPLGTYQFFIPRMQADAAPKAFDVEKNVKPKRWVILYTGTIVAPISTTFRFVGSTDDIMVVRLDRKVVLDGSIAKIADWKNDRKETVGIIASGVDTPLYAGDWINIEAGRSYQIEVLIGEQPGGFFSSFLFVQEKDKTYKSRPNKNGLILPLFQTEPTKLPRQNEETDAPTVKEAFAFSSPEKQDKN